MARGGPRPHSGGARAGAGRPTSEVADYRRQMQDELRAAVTTEDLRAIVTKAVAQAKEGDDRARQ